MNRLQKIVAKIFRIPVLDASSFGKNKIYFDQSQQNIPTVLGLSEERGEEIIRAVAKRFDAGNGNTMTAFEEMVLACQNNQEVVFTAFCAGVNKAMRDKMGSVLGMIFKGIKD